ncbi:MAG TPA: hypothetical protein VMY76_06960 [Gemmatimonadales bacterium]|nr:hypothetical protein [Gemmatimonadales bacterium]
MARRVVVSPEVTALALLDRVDYVDAFAVPVPRGRRPEDLFRSALATAPHGLLSFVRLVQTGLGLRLAPTSAEHPLGWTILRSDDEAFILAAGGDAVAGRIVARVRAGEFELTTQLRLDTTRARVGWAIAAPCHRTVARYLLDRTARRAGATLR